MAKFAFKFIDELDDNWSAELKIIDFDNKKYIDIILSDENERFISFTLSKSTAIKFSKTMRTLINKLTESEVNNG